MDEFFQSPLFVILRDLIAGFIAVALYSVLMNSPKRTVLVSAAMGAAGYVLYDMILVYGKQEFLGYFIGTLLVSICGEIMARLYKMPSTIFIFPGIIPLVPGIGLYTTMLNIVNGQFDSAMEHGSRALLSAGVMAIAIALTNLTARYIFPKKEAKTIIK